MITNQQPQTFQNSHSRVIYKNFNDTDTRDFLNSYRYEPSRNRKYKKWKPDISPEERFKKKRDREEEYLQNFHPDDRPVLVVQKKHEYQDIENPNVFVDPGSKEAYYKVSENTDTVDDITQEIKQLENFIKRHTVVHKKGHKKDEENLSSIYKVEGKEFLPEGFIELDPLLYKDEYEFDNELDQKRFEKEQRKLKMLRRKQYEQRHDNKIRDVTIFVMDEQKNRTLMFIEKWVDQHRRKMNKAEIEYVADNLQVAPHKLRKLQDLYFKKMEILRNRQFGNEGLTGQSHLKDIPSGIRSQFQQKKFDDIDSKYMKSQEPYKPSFLNKQKKPKNKKKSNQNSQLIDTKELDETLKETSQEKVKQKQGNSYSQLHSNKYKQDSKTNNINQNTSRKSSQKNYRKDSKKTSRANISNKQSNDKFSNQISQNSKQFSQGKQSKNKIEDLTNPFEQMLNNDNNLKKQDTNENLQVLKNDKKENFENDLQKYFDDEIHSILNKIKDTGSQKNNLIDNDNKDEETPESREYIDSFKQKLIKNDNNLKQLVNQESQPITREKQQTEVQNIPIQKLPKRLTIFAQNQQGDLKTTFKLKPIILGNEYFYQTVQQKYNPDRSIEATLTTKNDQGQVLDVSKIPKKKVGKFYSNEVLEKQPDFQGDQGKYIVVKNDKDEIVHKQIIRPRQELLDNNKPEEQLKVENFKKEKIHEDRYIKTHNLNPIEFNGKEFKQVIEEIKDENDNKQINILTYDNNNEILANEKIKPFFQTETYYSEIKTEILNDNKKKFSLITKNKNGEILTEFDLDKIEEDNKDQYMNNQTIEQDRDTTIYNLNPVIVGDRILKQEIHLPNKKSKAFIKTFNDYNKEINSQPVDKKYLTAKDYSELSDNDDRLELLTKNQNGNVVGQFILPDEYNKVVKNDKFDEIIEIIDNEGQRRATIATKALPEFQFRSYQLRPTLIGNQFYQQTINELVKNQDSDEPQAVLITKNEEGEILDIQDIEDSKIAQDYYNQIIDENIDEFGKRKATLITYNNNNEEIGRVDISQSLAQKTGDQHYEEVLEELVNEDDNKSDQIELIKIDKNDDGKVEVQQVQVDKEQVQDLQPVGNEEYYDKLVDIFAQKNPRRSFQKNEGFINRDKAQTYAQIPFDYQGPQMLTQESKKQIDKFVKEVKEANQQQIQEEQEDDYQQDTQEDEQQQDTQEDDYQQDTQKDEQYEDIEEEVYEEEPQSRKQTRRVTKDSQPQFGSKQQIEEVQNKFEPRKSQVSQYSTKYGPLEGYKKARERVRSKTKKSKSKKNQPMSFEDMEKKLSLLEKKKNSQISPNDETRSKQTSVIGKDFRPSKIAKIYEDKYGNIQRGSERFKKESVGVRDYSKTIQPMAREQNLIDQNLLQNQSEKQIENIRESINDFDKDVSIMDNKEFLKTEKEIHDIVESQRDIQSKQSQREVDKQQSQREVDKQQSQREVDKQQSQREVDNDNKIGSKRSMKKKQSKRSTKLKQSKKKLNSKKNIGSNKKIKSSKRNIGSQRETIIPEEQVVFEGLKEKDNYLLDEILKKKNEDQEFEIQNQQDEDEGSNITPKDLDKSYASAVTYELKKQVNRDKDLVDRLAKGAGLSRGELLQDFYDFCVRLPGDKKYKESIVFATMFYFYMEKKKKEI